MKCPCEGKKAKSAVKPDWLFFVSLQTDDKGVFCTDLSQEYELAASTFELGHEAVWTLSQQAIDCAFADEALKQQLKQKWSDLQPQVLNSPAQKV